MIKRKIMYPHIMIGFSSKNPLHLCFTDDLDLIIEMDNFKEACAICTHLNKWMRVI